VRHFLQLAPARGEPDQPGPGVRRVRLAAHVAAALEVPDELVHRLLGHGRALGEIRHPQPVDRAPAEHLHVRGPQVVVAGEHLVAHGRERPVGGHPQQAGDADGHDARKDG
jgi:hypothetical protein